jgi:parallel beta-helix repeat protein
MTPKKILILAANPLATAHLRLDEEMREIDEGLRRSKWRDRFVLVKKTAVTARSLRQALLDEEPQIVHFSGHGAREDGLVLENLLGQPQLVETQALAMLFELFTDSVECILLNACYSQIQATAIAQHIGFTIGMNKAIGDRAAIEFALGFYDALGAGRTYDIAYKFACNAIHLGGIDEYLTPDLIKRGEQAPPAKVVSSSVPDFSRTVTTPTPTVSSGEAVQTLVVSAMGRGQYRTISEAMEAAKDGAKILVKEGIYREGLVIDKPVEMIGDGQTSEIILEYSDGNCILMQTDYAKVKGLTICGQAGLKGKEYFAVDIPQGCLILEDCDITSDSFSCIGIHGLTAKPRISRCKIHDSKQGGIVVKEKGQGIVENCDIFANIHSGVAIYQEANPTIRSCKIHDNKANGILVWEKGQGIVENCDIFANTLSGVEIQEEANPAIRRCKIHDGKAGGILVWQRGQGIVEDCDIFTNALSGVEIQEEGNPTIRRCKIHDNAGGILVQTKGQGIVEDCDIFANTLSSVQIQEEGNPTIRRCKIHDGKSSGIFVYKKGQGIVEDCDIFANTNAGVRIKEEGNPIIQKCRINRNGYEAIWSSENGRGTVENCDLTGNKRGAFDIDSTSQVQQHNNKT